MDRIGEYEIRESLNEEPYFHLFRGWHEKQGRSFLLKWTKASHPSLKEIAQLKNGYDLLKGLRIETIPQVYQLEKLGNSFLMVLEDIEGTLLSSILHSTKHNLEESLKYISLLAKTLGDLHLQKIIHKNVNPHNHCWLVFNGQ